MSTAHPLIQDGALTLYDIATDEHRPATQDDVERLIIAAARYVKLRDGVEALIRSGDFISCFAMRELLAKVEPKP